MENLSNITTEQFIDNSAYIAARGAYLFGAAYLPGILRNIAVASEIASSTPSAVIFADRFMKAFDRVIGANPIIITNEGSVIWNASQATVAESRQLIQAFEGLKNNSGKQSPHEILDDAKKVLDNESKIKVKTVSDLIKDAKPTPKTGGPSTIYEFQGGFQKALKDFESLQLKNVRDISDNFGIKKVGVLEDGRSVVVRNMSSKGNNYDSLPTLEIQNNRTYIKFRYFE